MNLCGTIVTEVVQTSCVWWESDLVNLLLLPFEILPSCFEALGFIERGLSVCSQFVQFVLECKVIL